MIEEQIEKLKTLQESYDAVATTVENQLPALADKIDNIDLSPIENKVDEGVSTLSTKIDNIDLSSVAKQGDNQEATNSKILEEVQNKLTPLDAVLTELNNGKQEMVNALAMKNVQSSTNKTLSAIADDVRSIAQSPITIDGGEMYEKQLFGAPTDKTNAYEQPNSPMWNLYQVMTNLLNDGRFINFQGIVLAEYTRDAESIELNIAGAGGAYLTSDGALYYADVTHTWNDLLDGKSNRWVAYLFANEYKSFEVSATDITPTSIHIGRKVGSIIYAADGRLSDIVVTDGNTLRDINFATGVQNFGKVVSIKNIETQTSGTLLNNNNAVETLIYDIETITSGTIVSMSYSSGTWVSKCPNITSMIFPRLKSFTSSDVQLFNHMNYKTLQVPKLEHIALSYVNNYYSSSEKALIYNTKLERLDFPSLKSLGYATNSCVLLGTNTKLKEAHFDNFENIACGDYILNSLVSGKGHSDGLSLFFPKAKSITGYLIGGGAKVTNNVTTNVKYILVGCCGDKSEVINITIEGNRCTNAGLIDVEIGDKEYIDKGLEPRWKPCQSIYFSSNKIPNKGEDELLEENMVNHILKRLKQDEEMCGSGVTIALGATNLAKLTSEESVELLDSLTNTYGYTFA